MLRWLGRLFGGGASGASGGVGPVVGAVPPGSARVARDRLSLILQSNTRALNDFSMVDMHKEIFQVIQVRPSGGPVGAGRQRHLALTRRRTCAGPADLPPPAVPAGGAGRRDHFRCAAAAALARQWFPLTLLPARAPPMLACGAHSEERPRHGHIRDADHPARKRQPAPAQAAGGRPATRDAAGAAGVRPPRHRRRRRRARPRSRRPGSPGDSRGGRTGGGRQRAWATGRHTLNTLTAGPMYTRHHKLHYTSLVFAVHRVCVCVCVCARALRRGAVGTAAARRRRSRGLGRQRLHRRLCGRGRRRDAGRRLRVRQALVGG